VGGFMNSGGGFINIGGGFMNSAIDFLKDELTKREIGRCNPILDQNVQ